MNNHEFRRSGVPGDHWVLCSCGDSSPHLHFTWQVEDWERDHMVEVTQKRSRVKAIRPPREKTVPDEDQLPLF